MTLNSEVWAGLIKSFDEYSSCAGAGDPFPIQFDLHIKEGSRYYRVYTTMRKPRGLKYFTKPKRKSERSDLGVQCPLFLSCTENGAGQKNMKRSAVRILLTQPPPRMRL